MIHNNIDTETQADIQILGKIDDFLTDSKLPLPYINVAAENNMGTVCDP